jgi:Tfp pilus assembly protein FimT
MDGRFMKSVLVISVMFVLLFPNFSGNITGTSEKNYLNELRNTLGNVKNNKEDLSDVVVNASRSNNGLANSPWPMFEPHRKKPV